MNRRLYDVFFSARFITPNILSSRLSFPCKSFTGDHRARSLRVGYDQKGASRVRSLEIQPAAFVPDMNIPCQGLLQLMGTLKQLQGP